MARYKNTALNTFHLLLSTKMINPHAVGWVLALSITIGTTGCSLNRPQNHATFGSQAATAAAPASGSPLTLRLYVDGHGSLYPDVALPNDQLLKGGYKSSLLNYYYYPGNAAAITTLCQHYGVALPSPAVATDIIHKDASQHWAYIQQVLVKAAAQRINTAVSGPNNSFRPLIILIHGYNVGDQEHIAQRRHGRLQPTYYDTLQHALVLQRPELQNAVWLEVFWDGLRQNVPLTIWGAGQLNARYVGLRLREVLAATNPALPIRFFTHSSGGIVAAQTLWNSQAGFDSKYDLPEIRHWYEQAPTLQHQDIRVGMIVPALTPDAFKDYAHRTTLSGQTQTTNQPLYRIIVGQNRKDLPTTKAFMPPTFLGSTAMGCSEKAFNTAKEYCSCDLKRIDFCQTKPGHIPPRAYQFRLGPVPLVFWEVHDWRMYLHRDEASRKLLSAVLD